MQKKSIDGIAFTNMINDINKYKNAKNTIDGIAFTNMINEMHKYTNAKNQNYS